MKRLLKLIITISLASGWIWADAQTIQATVQSVSDCPGEGLLPITVTDANNIGAISLTLDYDPANGAFLSHEDVHPQLSGGMLIVNGLDDKIIISWASSNAANIGAGTLMNLRFSGTPGTVNVSWDTQTSGNCEFADASGNVLPASYTNGQINFHQPPLIQTQPQDVGVLTGQNASFFVGAIATGIGYEWFRSTDGGSNWYSTGVENSTLNLYDVSLEMDGYLYRCVVTGVCTPDVVSDPVQLSVIQPLITSFELDDVCEGTVQVPVLTSNFTDVASLSLTFAYNNSLLSYSGLLQSNPALTGNFICNEVDGTIYMTWSSASGVSFAADTVLAILEFDALPGNAAFSWDLATPDACVYTYANADPVVSVFEDASLGVLQHPVINAHPQDRLIPENTGTSFSVSASGAGLLYQWQYSPDNGTTWNNISGANSSSYSFSSASLGMNGFLYHCEVNGTCPPSVVSNNAMLTVLPRVSALLNEVSDCPGSITIPVDVEHFFDVAAFSLALSYDTSYLTFEGYQNAHTALAGGNLLVNAAGDRVYLIWSSTTEATIGDDQLLELNFTGETGNGTLDWQNESDGLCEFVNADGDIYFDNYVDANVTVFQPPQIIAQPEDEIVPQNTSATFQVSATGTNLGYQWQESTDGGNTWMNLSDGTPYSGVSSSSLTLNPVGVTLDGNQYRCTVSGTCSPAETSQVAMLVVLPPVITTSATDVINSCTGNIEVPIVVSNANNVGAISLVLSFDPAKVSFNGYKDVHAGLNSGMLIVNDLNDKVILSWASSSAANIGFGELITFSFIANTGISTTLSWDLSAAGNCEYSDPSGFIYFTNFNNGDISVQSNALLADAGGDKVISSGGSVELNGQVSGGNAPYTILWEPATGLSDPGILNPVASPMATTEYTVTISDNLGCYSEDQVTVEVADGGFYLDLFLFLEGPFVAGEMSPLLNASGYLPVSQPYGGSPWNYTGTEAVTSIPNSNVVDWVLIELRQTNGDASTATSDKRVARQAAFLLKNGQVVGEDGSGLPLFNLTISQNLYVVVYHRNHIPVMSASALTLTGDTYPWDFTSGIGQAYGSNSQVNLGSVYGMFAGDANGDGSVLIGDKNSWAGDAGKSGYFSPDLNLDGQVNNRDKNEMLYKNINETTQLP